MTLPELSGKLAAIFKNPDNPFQAGGRPVESQAPLRRVDASGERVYAPKIPRREETGQA